MPFSIWMTPVPATLPTDVVYGGIPHGSFDLAISPGTVGVWQLSVQDADLQQLPASLLTSVTIDGATHFRLNAGLVVDLLLVFHYAVT